MGRLWLCPVLGQSEIVCTGRVIYYQLGGGRLHFHVMYKKFYDPPPPIPLEKNLDPRRFMTKMFVTPPPPPIVSTPAPKHNPLFLLY